MTDEFFDDALIRALRSCSGGIPQAVANDLSKANKVFEIDPEMSLVRMRRALDLIMRGVASVAGIIPGTKPIEQLLVELTKVSAIPPIVQKHCRVIKEFGNLAAHGNDEFIHGFEENDITEMEAKICAQSMIIVANWYKNKIVPQSDGEGNYIIVTGQEITTNLIDQAIEIDKINYLEQFRGIRDTCLEWHARNSQIYTMILDPITKNVVGYINSMPLEANFFNKIKSGTTIDLDIPPCEIRKYDLPDFYLMYFSSIGIHPSYHSTNAFRFLYDAFIKKLIILAKNEIFISEVIADAITPEGRQLCSFAGMKEVCKTNHNSSIYHTTLLPPALRATTISGKSLLAFYRKKYDEFRDIIDTHQT